MARSYFQMKEGGAGNVVSEAQQQGLAVSTLVQRNDSVSAERDDAPFPNSLIEFDSANTFDERKERLIQAFADKGVEVDAQLLEVLADAEYQVKQQRKYCIIVSDALMLHKTLIHYDTPPAINGGVLDVPEYDGESHKILFSNGGTIQTLNEKYLCIFYHPFAWRYTALVFDTAPRFMVEWSYLGANVAKSVGDVTWWVNVVPYNIYNTKTLIGFAPFGVWSSNYEEFTKMASGFPSQIFADNGLRQKTNEAGYLDFYQDAGACSKGTLSTIQYNEENSASDALFVVNAGEWNWEYDQYRAEDYLGGSNPLSSNAKFFHAEFAVSAGALKRALGVSRVSFSTIPSREPTEDEPHLYGKALDYIEAQGDSNEAVSSNRLSAKLWQALGLRLGEYATDTSNGAVSGFVACVDVSQYEKIILNTATVNAEDYNNWNVTTGRYDGRNQRVYVHQSQPVYTSQEVSVVTVETRDNGNDKFNLYARDINFGAYGIEAKILVKGETSEGWERLTDEAQFERMYEGYQIPILTAVLAQNNNFGEETTHIEWYIADKSKSQFSAIGAGGIVEVTLDQIISALGLLQMSSNVDKIVEFFKSGITLTFIINPWIDGSQPPRPIRQFMLGNRIEGSEPINDWRNL